MALTLKKAFAANEICTQWLEFGADIFIMIYTFPDPTERDTSSNGMAMQVRRSTDGGTVFTTIMEISSFDTLGGRLFSMDSKLYLLDRTSGVLVIREWSTPDNWTIVRTGPYDQPSSFVISDPGLYVNAGHPGFSTIGKLLKWAGGSGLWIDLSPATERVGGVCLDPDGHIFFITHTTTSPANSIKIYRIDKTTEVQTLIATVLTSGVKTSAGIAIFDGKVYFLVDQIGTTLYRLEGITMGSILDNTWDYDLPDSNPALDSFPRFWGLWTGNDGKLYLSYLDEDNTVYITSFDNLDNAVIEKHYAATLNRVQQGKLAWGYLQIQGSGNMIIGANNEFYETEESEPPPPPDPVPPGVLVVNAKPVNAYNFVSWFNCNNGPLNFTQILCTNCCWDLPKGYDENRDLQRIHAPILAWNETNAFYINFDTPQTDVANFPNWKLGLINSIGLVKDDIGTLEKHDVPGMIDNFNVFCSDLLITDDVSPGIYRMVIYNEVTEGVLWMSNAMEIMDPEQAKCESVRVENRHVYNIYKYYYEVIDPNFLNRIRLRLYRIDENTEGELTQYRAVSSGQLRNVSFELDKFIVLEAYWFDDLAHRAMFVLQACQYIAINTFLYLPKVLYKWEFDATKKLNKGRIELFEQAFSTANRYKPLTQITVIGSEDPLLLGDDGGAILL